MYVKNQYMIYLNCPVLLATSTAIAAARTACGLRLHDKTLIRQQPTLIRAMINRGNGYVCILPGYNPPGVEESAVNTFGVE
ncbi:hypothetical protein C8Q75DRAFT_811604 [Abortiporus biennis]|nr:hypothetical protein C8Q75DRAFT_811604 [Abortiporus biennis]